MPNTAATSNIIRDMRYSRKVLTEVMPDDPKAEQGEGSSNAEDPSILLATISKSLTITFISKPHVLRSIQPIVSRLIPSVFAVSSNFRLVPFSMPLCSTRFSSAARP